MNQINYTFVIGSPISIMVMVAAKIIFLSFPPSFLPASFLPLSHFKALIPRPQLYLGIIEK